MTSASARGAKSTGYDEPRGLGLVFFAAIMLLVVGLFNVIDGIAAIANSHLFVANAHYVFGDLRAWGWVVLILGLLQLLAGGGVMVGNQAARWFGIAVIGLNLVCSAILHPCLSLLGADHYRVRRVRALRALPLRQPGQRDGRLTPDVAAAPHVQCSPR